MNFHERSICKCSFHDCQQIEEWRCFRGISYEESNVFHTWSWLDANRSAQVRRASYGEDRLRDRTHQYVHKDIRVRPSNVNQNVRNGINEMYIVATWHSNGNDSERNERMTSDTIETPRLGRISRATVSRLLDERIRSWDGKDSWEEIMNEEQPVSGCHRTRVIYRDRVGQNRWRTRSSDHVLLVVSPVMIQGDFSTNTMNHRREWHVELTGRELNKVPTSDCGASIWTC
jgi:hypothetical protein